MRKEKITFEDVVVGIFYGFGTSVLLFFTLSIISFDGSCGVGIGLGGTYSCSFFNAIFDPGGFLLSTIFFLIVYWWVVPIVVVLDCIYYVQVSIQKIENIKECGFRDFFALYKEVFRG